MLKLENIKYLKNNNLILDNINFEIKQGDFIYLIGKNGSGKTTLAHIIAGLIKNYEGSITFNNQIIDNENDTFFEEIVGYIFQNPDNQFLTSIVEYDLGFGLEKYNLSYEITNAKIKEILQKMEIKHLINRNISTLSGGEKQRIAIAAMLLLKKEIIIFDEPTSMLDPFNAKKILDLIVKLNRDEQKTIILITHEKPDLNLNIRTIEIRNKQLYEK